MIVANPPYIPAGFQIRTPQVRDHDHDPTLSLWAGTDGMSVILAVERTARRLLTLGGRIFLEHGPYLTVLALFTTPDWSDPIQHHTIDDRVLIARRT